MTAPFTLDSRRAYLALTQHHRREKWRPEIPASFCAAFDSEGRVASLVASAIEHGVITCPPGMTLQFVLEDPAGDEAYYQWQVEISKPVFLTVCSRRTPVTKLGCGDVSGIRGPEEAQEVLDEAVQAGNWALRGLGMYMQAVTTGPMSTGTNIQARTATLSRVPSPWRHA